MKSSAIPPIRPPLTVSSVHWEHPDAVALRAEMAAEVRPRYADLEQTLRTDPHAVDPATVHRTFVAYSDEPAGHAGIRWNADDLEVKRMFVRPARRGSGAAALLLGAAEDAARAAGRPRLILQTGHLQPEAVRFYRRSGYHRIPIFSPYEPLPLSNCFAKDLS
ncbi:GNAT family N-acetyltransferase [Nocardia sp. NBC_00881]|uniref:GNAT family N-acetyltransferase n=1 Tax=Nocardia sp. NBC_00881 TaxID=2975995 RepID=UPI00386C08CE|nr:GNAT family N-acetyltransferase [Nocardia sp. NBC_00881]